MNALFPALPIWRPIWTFATAIGTGHPDASLLGLRAELRAAVAGIVAVNLDSGVSDEDLDRASYRLTSVCSAIVDSAPAQTREGRALKAAAAMQKLRDVFNADVENDWPGLGEEAAWHVLSEIAGGEYVPAGEDRFEPPRRSKEPSAGRAEA